MNPLEDLKGNVIISEVPVIVAVPYFGPRSLTGLDHVIDAIEESEATCLSYIERLLTLELASEENNQ